MKKRTGFLLNLIVIVLILGIFIANQVMDKSLAEEQNVVLSIVPKPKIDIVLAKARTKTDVTNFKTDIVEALKKVNVDTSDLHVSAVETQKVNMQSAFSWVRDVSPLIGSINITNNGQNVAMAGNSSSAGKNAIWIIPDGNQEQKFTFGYGINFGDSFNAAGMLLRVKREGNTLTGYMLSFNNTWKAAAENKNGAIWKFTYPIGSNTTNMTKTLVKGIDIATSGTLTITATDAEIVIEGGGMASSVICDIPDDDQTIGNGFGFFSDHYSHDCSNIGSFSLTNINMETTVLKTFDEILREPEWRVGAYEFLVDIDDTENQELKNNSSYGEIATRLINDNVHFVSWGKTKNQSQFTQLIEANNQNGKFIMNDNYDNSMSETATYIESVIKKIGSTQTVIVNDPVSLTVTPPGIDRNTIDSDWPYGKWKIDHDYTYYENNIGQFAESGKYISNLITSFNKTGRYMIKYKDKAIYPQEVFVHRRPVAQMTMGISGTNVTLGSESYDKDKISQNNGIAEEEWKWRESTSTTWNVGKLTTIDNNKTYIVQLRVKDFQDTWSIPTSRYITNDRSALPVAMYNITDDILTKYQDITIKDNSYDPAGRAITSRLWEVYKDGNKIYSGATPKVNYSDQGSGTYTMYLTVTNSDNLTSERYGRTFEIAEDTLAPEVVATPITAPWAKSTTVHLKFTDEGGSGFRGYKYAITSNQSTPTTWNEEIRKAEDDVIINTEGKKYLHIIAYDNANNVSNDRILGPYEIDHSGPTIEVEGDFNTITTKPITCHIQSTDLLSGLKTVSVNGETLKDLGNSAIEIYRNGTYTVRAEDNVGNSSTKDIVVTNVYKECTAGLEHPIYSTSLDKCPICSLIGENSTGGGLQVTKNREVYDSHEKHVTYDNPNNATIVEYYNGTKQKPSQVGSYPYNLKVVYEGKEYNTGITGTFEITKKTITIENIAGKNRQYDGTDKIALSEGSLVGVEEGDKVGFTLPLMGTVASKEIGQYNVKIPEIVLTGEKAENYELTQPSEEMLKATIKPRELTITELEAVSRPYNKKAEIEIVGGKLNNLIEGNTDHIGFTLNGGVARSELAGEQIVDVNTIELTNNEVGNYVLIPPELLTVWIEKKQVAVENMKATNRQYDGTDQIALTGGNLIGIEEGDDAVTTLPERGTIASKDVGDYNVVIPEIVLSGEKAPNYQMIQPAEDAVKVSISPRELTMDKLKVKDRRYDKTKVVEIESGELKNVVGQDEVKAIIPKTGTISNSDIGTWPVKIEPIKLEGKDSPNYVLIQPKAEDMLVEISKPNKPNLQLETFISKLNGKALKDVEPTVMIEDAEGKETDVGTGTNMANKSETKLEEKNDNKTETNDKKNTAQETKTDEKKDDKTEEKKHADITTKTDVKAKADAVTDTKQEEEEKTKTETNSDEKEKTETKIELDEKEEEKTDTKTETTKTAPSAEIKESKKKQGEIRFGDKIMITVRIYNTGEGNGYAQKITNVIPKGMKFVADDSINKENKWKKVDDNTVVTEKLNFASGEENEIEKLQDEAIYYEDVDLVLEVTEQGALTQAVENGTTIEQVDIRNEKIEYADDENEKVLPIKISYTDFVVEKTLEDVIEMGPAGDFNHTVAQANNKFSKIEIGRKNINATQIKVVYNITVTNRGDAKGTVDAIVDYLPKGLQASMVDNQGWTMGNGNSLICQSMGELEPGETKSKELVVTGKASQITGNRENQVVVLSNQDIDQRKIQQKNKADVNMLNVDKELFKTNNYSKADLIVSIGTGGETNYLIWLGILTCMIIGGGILIYFKGRR